MKISERRLRRFIRQSLIEAYEKSDYVQDLPDYERLEKMKKAGRFEKSNISTADEEEAAAHIKYREDLRKENERKRAEIDQIRQDRNARKKGERYRYDMEDVKNFMSETMYRQPGEESEAEGLLWFFGEETRLKGIDRATMACREEFAEYEPEEIQELKELAQVLISLCDELI